VESFRNWIEERTAQINPEWTDDLNAMVEIATLGEDMLRGYAEHYKDDKSFEVIATEHQISSRIPIPDGDGALSRYTLTARLDGIVRDAETGRLFSLEHKTYSKSSVGHFDLDHQFTAQVWLGGFLAESLDVDNEVIGVIYNGLRKQASSARVTSPLFMRQKIFRTPAQIDAMLHRAYWQCREMSSKNLPIYPQPNMIRCSGCVFKEVCMEYQRGGDWEFLLEESFISRDEREEEKI
jgi:hypothetical protein